MKTFIIFLTLMIFSTTNVNSKEAVDCKNVKKFSMKAAMCKIKSVGKSTKNKLSKKEKSGKKTILQKFGEAKTLSDLKK